MTEPTKYYVVAHKESKSQLEIHTNFFYQFENPMPNRWFRIWQYLFLGWKWTVPNKKPIPGDWKWKDKE